MKSACTPCPPEMELQNECTRNNDQSYRMKLNKKDFKGMLQIK